MQFEEVDYWYEAWERDWQESLAYAFKKMQEQIDHDTWWVYVSQF